MTKRIIALTGGLAVSIALTGLPALAQRGGGAGRGMGGGMGMGQRPTGGFGHANNQNTPRLGNQQQGSMSRSANHAQQPNLGMNSPTRLLSQNTKLSSRLQSLLPAGTNLDNAVGGFKNLGLFVATVHVSHNLGIPFDVLKDSELSPGGNLGKAIHTLKPNLNKKQIKFNVKKARREAKRDLRETRS